MAEKEKIGVVFNYFAKPMVAAIKLTDGDLEVGDRIYIKGHTTNFEQIVESMQIEGRDIKSAKKGASIGIKVNERVRPNDIVYRIL